MITQGMPESPGNKPENQRQIEGVGLCPNNPERREEMSQLNNTRIREELLEIISSAIPETKENIEFCESDSFTLMLDNCIKSIRNLFESILEE